MSQQPALSCSDCGVPMAPAQIRNIRTYVQPTGKALSSDGALVSIFVCPRCGKIAARVEDRSLFGGAPAS